MAALWTSAWSVASASLVLVLLGPLLPGSGPGASSAAEFSKWRVSLPLLGKKYFSFGKILFSNSTVFIKFEGEEKNCDTSLSYNLTWSLRYLECYNEVSNVGEEQTENYLRSSVEEHAAGPESYASASLFFSSCTGLLKPQVYYKEKGEPMNAVTKTWRDGPYNFILQIEISSSASKESSDKVKSSDITEVQPTMSSTVLENDGIAMVVEVKGPYDYLSLGDYPLMIFFMVMCIVYVLFGGSLASLVCMLLVGSAQNPFLDWCCHLLGNAGEAVFYGRISEHPPDTKGESVQGAAVLAELLSAVKRSLARILVIIVSLGYGIVKPRLGATLHKVVVAGALYLLFSGMEGVLRATGFLSNTTAVVIDVGLSVTDACIILWIFISLTQTMKLLRLRRNIVKLSLYRHFTNTLILAVGASIVFIIWTTMKFRLVDCQSDWQELWVDDAIWRLLFSMILFVIMILWRPSANNQRFAFSPLTEEEEEDEQKEPMLTESFEGMKMRSTKQETNGNVKSNKTEDDLKWVEENIPSSVTDVALPSLLDSDEERMITHFERSKME
ncbi:LOW QUALITY PROTEIN: transmembrane protein 87A [Microcaecilia unicolor]|uniref:LOW QUALITY PROTEIN: transmembrane protein 87A n=1 Tax=Microcaecilia unicolor TaxID=1415580 RepID=A0A6P7Z4F9_9AMPH|nr:LOW QUALITY PROTEIN: transmembrane protein 87A [Microcaecilia unicolor]